MVKIRTLKQSVRILAKETGVDPDLTGGQDPNFKLSPDLHLDQVGFAAGRLEGAALAGEARPSTTRSSASSSTFTGSRRTVDPWVPSLTRLPLRRRVSSRSTILRSSTSTAQQDLAPANLPFENYASGLTAPYNSWCLLEKDEAAE